MGDHAHHGGGDPGQRAGQGTVAAQPLDVRRSEQDEQEAGHEGDPGGQQRSQDRRHPRVQRARRAVGADERDELDHHHQRPRGGLGEGQTAHHLAGGQPAVDLDRLLGHERQHGVGAAEGDQGGPGEEQPLVDQDARGAQQQRRRRDGRRPQHQSHAQHRGRAPRARGLAVQRVVGDQGCRANVGRTGGRLPHPGQHPAQDPPGECRAGDHERERDPEQGQRAERRHGQAHQRRVQQRAPGDPHDGLRHDRDDRRREPEEERLHHGGLAVGDVDAREHQQCHGAGQDEQHAGNQRAAHAVEQPADVRRQLLRLGPRQQGAVGEGEEEALLADPAGLLDQHPLHHRDLARRAAEGLQGDREPHPRRGTQRDDVAGAEGHVRRLRPHRPGRRPRMDGSSTGGTP